MGKNSSLVSVTVKSPNHSGRRAYKVTRISPHCMVGQMTAKACGSLFAKASYQASSNYGIGKDGEIGLYVDEENRSWCSSSADNDNRAITIECASDTKSPYKMNDKVYKSLVNLCVDICRRYGKTKLIWFGDRARTLNYKPADNEMVITVHRWFANKSCPGDWLYSRLGKLADQVTAQLPGTAQKTAEKKTAEEKTAEEKTAEEKTVEKKTAEKKAAEKQITEEKAAKEKTAEGKLYKVQCGAFRTQENAQKRVSELKAAGFDAVIQEA